MASIKNNNMSHKNALKLIKYLTLLVISFNLLSCVTNTYKEDNSVSPRFFEEKGGFSYIPPKGWRATEISGFEYKVFMEQENKNAGPNIGFATGNYNGSLNEFVTLLIESFNNKLGENFKLLQRDNFVTLKNLNGERIIINIIIDGQCLRQYYYFFKEKENITQAVCSVLEKYGNTYDEIFNKTMKTFEWIDHKTKDIVINKEKYFIEESGKFLIIPYGLWREIIFKGEKYKTIILGDVAAVNFEIITYYDKLSVFIDLLIEKIKKVYGEGFEFIQRSDFVTSKNVKGERIILKLIDNEGAHYRQIIYCLPGNNKKIISILCVVSEETGDSYDDIFDKTMKTFEWIE
jgi:hypothetical protein